ncbi:hypothetical protein Bca4012_046804 [Brassica carinata]
MCCVFALSQALSGCLHLQLSPSSSKLHRPNPSLSTRPNPSLSSLSSSLSISLTGACYCLLFSETVNGFVLTGIQENAFVICFFFFLQAHTLESSDCCSSRGLSSQTLPSSHSHLVSHS